MPDKSTIEKYQNAIKKADTVLTANSSFTTNPQNHLSLGLNTRRRIPTSQLTSDRSFAISLKSNLPQLPNYPFGTAILPNYYNPQAINPQFQQFTNQVPQQFLKNTQANKSPIIIVNNNKQDDSSDHSVSRILQAQKRRKRKKRRLKKLRLYKKRLQEQYASQLQQKQPEQQNGLMNQMSQITGTVMMYKMMNNCMQNMNTQKSESSSSDSSFEDDLLKYQFKHQN